MESIVARPAPIVSIPFGRRTNMNSGSRAILRIPPMDILGMAIAMEVGDMIKAGKSVEEVLKWAETGIYNYAVYFMADNLNFFRRSGRVSGLAPSPARSLSIKSRNTPAYKRPLSAAA